MKLPSRREAIELLKEFKIMPNIMEHTKMVNKVANYLAKKLIDVGVPVDLELVDIASLLHDVAKSEEIRLRGATKNDQHHIAGENILARKGFPELGRVVRHHHIKEIENATKIEEKIIKYADLRVKHTKIVSVKERLDDLNKRYNVPEEERIPEEVIFALEKEIYAKLKEKPEDLEKGIK